MLWSRDKQKNSEGSLERQTVFQQWLSEELLRQRGDTLDTLMSVFDVVPPWGIQGRGNTMLVFGLVDYLQRFFLDFLPWLILWTMWSMPKSLQLYIEKHCWRNAGPFRSCSNSEPHPNNRAFQECSFSNLCMTLKCLQWTRSPVECFPKRSFFLAILNFKIREYLQKVWTIYVLA